MVNLPFTDRETSAHALLAGPLELAGELTLALRLALSLTLKLGAEVEAGVVGVGDTS